MKWCSVISALIPNKSIRIPVEDWQQEVAADDTRKGYWEWVKANIEETEDDDPGE